MALFSAASLSPHSLMPLSCSSTSTSSSIIKLFSPVTRFSKTPQAFISSIPSTKIRDPSLSRLQLQPIRSSTSSSSIHGSEGEGDSSPPASRIFIKGLSRSTSEGCLLKTFSCFGEISKVKLITSKSSKQPLGLAYIWFVREEDALSAVKEMNGKFVDGRFMIVMMARPEAPSKHVRTAPYSFYLQFVMTFTIIACYVAR